ncbi:hypothetical protein [Herbiconiux sp. A18JL235]|uniref:Neutral/alkaline non-lysosomal ceramidase N-terminal domain-containing protein n=1 Tax=Herbiconiux sp. A18JL235 TaxID=3152363 RepID=A0AB39BHY2_9MICO
MTTNGWKAGVARADITPDLGLAMDGYLGRGPATGIGAPLTATALALSAGREVGAEPQARSESSATVIVCCDLLCLSSTTLERVRESLRAQPDLEVDLLLSCSHTHTGPVTEGHDLLGVARDARSADYLDVLVGALADLVVAAVDALEPATVSYARAEAAIGVNRRRRDAYGTVHMEPNPDGDYDPRVDVLRVDRCHPVAPLAVVMNAACHAVSLGDLWRQWHPDFPGVARDLVEAETGAVALFVQGAAGDVNSLLFGHDAANPEILGTRLGEAVVDAWRGASALQPMAPVNHALSRSVVLPRLRPATVEEADARVMALERELALIEADAPDDPKYLRWAQVRLQNARAGRDGARGGASESFVEELTAVALDRDTAIVTAPGEVFTALAVRIRARSPFVNLFYAGYTNGSVYYVPTREAYAEGGYEIESACFVAPEAGESLVEATVELLEQLHRSL